MLKPRNIFIRSLKPITVLIASVFTICNAAPAISKSPEKPVIEESKIEIVRDKITKGYLYSVSSVDNYFSGTAIESEKNESYLKLDTSASVIEGADNERDVRLKGKIDLPNTQKRFRIFFDSNLQENNSLEDNNRTVSSGDRVRERSTVTGIEFLKKPKKSDWRYSAHIGVKGALPIQLFTRFRGRRKWKLSDDWSSMYRQDVWYLDGVGWGETSRLEFLGVLSDSLRFRTVSEVKLSDEPEPLEYLQEWILSKRINSRRGVDYRLGHFNRKTTDDVRFDHHFISVNLRQQIYKDWMFLSISPEVLFRQEDKWVNENSVTLRLEVFLTDF